MFVSFLVLCLYGLPYVLSPGIIAGFVVSTVSAVLAGVTFTVAVVAYLWAPKKQLALVALALYILLIATTGTLVIDTGGTSSPFIALWIATALFAGVFSYPGLAMTLSVGVGYLAYTALQQTPTENMIIAALAVFTPIIASFIIWHNKSSKDNQRERAYQELASELSHEANKADVVINAIEDGVVSIDKQGVIQLINPAAQQIIGWSSGDAVGLSYKSVIKLRDRDDKEVTVSNDPVEKVLATSKEISSEDFCVQTDAGRKVLLSIVVSPIGQPSTGAIVVFRDITEKKVAEREQAEFISTASHEMRTPVASIEGYLGLAMNPSTATVDARAQEYIQKAHESTQHLGRLFQDLLDVSKADDGRLNNTPKVVNVVEFIADIATGLEAKAKEKGLRFLYKPTSSDRPISDRLVAPVYYANVDNDHLREVVSNLIENAIKYTPQGDVIIDVTSDQTYVTVSVADSGIGIPTEDIPHLFQKFYRVDNSDTREIGGTGLGLYLCRRLAEVMNGRIRVESEYKKGSTFYLDIPRIEHEEATKLMEEATIKAEQASTQPEISNIHTESQPIPPTPVAAPPANVAPASAPQLMTPTQAAPTPRVTIQVPVRDGSPPQ